MTLCADTGKASLSLTVEVQLPCHAETSHHARNSPSRQRRREPRAAACEANQGVVEEVAHEAEPDVDAISPTSAELASENEASGKQNQTTEANSNVNDAG